ncbi:hypothetical protein HPB51_026966 [Rhipicephalus microplus]|uniref:Uncharacterized protein n=1 Tax=Rhipicephalus microplus TaxID=6941 RepID=A0A9J6D1X3_RHIMP|nr:hypothetical protein HPB51_026966 [Rhipicephalus microplus]
MTRHFKWYGTICKSSGLMISRSSETSESDRRVCFWNKLYLIYSVGCLSVCAIVEIGFFYQLCLAVFAHDVPFTTTVHVLLYVVVNAKVALNTTLATVKVRSMHRFFSESSKYEESVQFVAPRNHRRMTPTCCLIRFLLLSAFVANVCTCSYLSLEFVDRLGRGPALGAMLKLTCMAGNFLYYVFDAASFLVLRPCCEVIRLYIEHQHGVLRSIVRRKECDVIGSERRARLVEDVRFNLCTISDIKRRLNDIWQYAIVTSGGVLLFSFCIGVYLIFVEELWTLENFLAFLNTVSATLDFLDIVILSDAMVTEIGFFYQLCLAVFAHDVPFTTTVHVLLYVVVNAKVALNATLATVKVRSMHRFFSESSKYEESVQFVAPRNHRRMTPTCCLIRFLLLSAFVANVCTCSYLSLEFVDRLGRGPALGAMLKLTCMAGNFLYYVFDAASFLVLRPCCEVIRLYIEHQHGVLRSIVRRKECDVIGSERRARLVEDVRFNLCTISDIKRRLNDIWQYAIVTSGGVLLFSFCIGVYLIFVEELWTLENFLAFLNTVSATLDFLDIVILSDAMVTELLYLRKSLKPGEMALSAAGFFSLKSPMLVSSTHHNVRRLGRLTPTSAITYGLVMRLSHNKTQREPYIHHIQSCVVGGYATRHVPGRPDLVFRLAENDAGIQGLAVT